MMKASDNRKKKRVKMVAAASVVRSKHKNPPIDAEIINISYGGVGLYVKEPLSGQVEIAIILTAGPSKQVAETVCGQVSWKKPVGSKYAVGVSFLGLNPRDHSMLLAFLEQAIRS